MKCFSLYNQKLILFDFVFFISTRILYQESLFQRHALTQAFIYDITELFLSDIIFIEKSPHLVA